MWTEYNFSLLTLLQSHTSRTTYMHWQTRSWLYIYRYIILCVCVCVWEYVVMYNVILCTIVMIGMTIPRWRCWLVGRQRPTWPVTRTTLWTIYQIFKKKIKIKNSRASPSRYSARRIDKPTSACIKSTYIRKQIFSFVILWIWHKIVSFQRIF